MPASRGTPCTTNSPMPSLLSEATVETQAIPMIKVFPDGRLRPGSSPLRCLKPFRMASFFVLAIEVTACGGCMGVGVEMPLGFRPLGRGEPDPLGRALGTAIDMANNC